jgi:hypothetical protein
LDRGPKSQNQSRLVRLRVGFGAWCSTVFFVVGDGVVGDGVFHIRVELVEVFGALGFSLGLVAGRQPDDEGDPVAAGSGDDGSTQECGGGVQVVA